MLECFCGGGDGVLPVLLLPPPPPPPPRMLLGILGLLGGLGVRKPEWSETVVRMLPPAVI